MDAVAKLRVLFEADSSALNKSLADTSKKASDVGEAMKKAVNVFDGSKLASEAGDIAKGIEKIGGVSKLTESELKKVKGTTDEAVAKFKALGKDVPPDIAKLAKEIDHASRGMNTLGNETSEVEKKAGGLSGIFGKVTGALGSIGLAGMGISAISGVVGGVSDSFMGLIGSAEALGDAGARVGAVWGAEMQGVIEDNATIANSLGMTKTAYMDSVGALGQLTKSMGVNTDMGADMAMGITELIPKLAAYSGVEASVASDALEKALMGKTKGLANLGFMITDAEQKQKALAMGFGNEVAKLSEAELGQVNYALAMEKTMAAQDAWAGNSSDVEVSMQRVSAAIEDAKVALGEKLLPLIAPLASAFANLLPGALDMAIGAFQPLLNLFSTIGEFVQPVIDAFSERGIVGALRELGSGLDAAIGNSSEELFTFFGDIGFAIRDFQDALSSSDAESLLGKIADALRAIGGDNTPAMLVTIAANFDAIQAALSSIDWAGIIGIGIEFVKNLWTGVQVLWPAIQTLYVWIADNLRGAFEDLAPVIEEVIDWMIENKSVVVAVGGVIMALVGGPITALIGILAVLGTAWRENWFGIQEKVQAFMDWFRSSVVPTIQSVLSTYSAIASTALAGIAEFWRQHGDTIIAVVSWIIDYVSGLISSLFTVVSGIVNAGLALIRGDWEGFGRGLGQVVAGIVNLVANVFKGTYSAVKNVLSWVWDQLKSMFSSEGKKASDSLTTGLVDGIRAGAGRVYQAIKDLASGLIAGFMDAIDAHSPSKVFAELGEWITAGLASGIADDSSKVKAIEAILKITNAIAQVAGALPDAMKKLAEASIPDDATIAKMSSQFDRMFDIVEKFVKRLSVRSVILGITGSSNDAPDAVKQLLRQYGLDPTALLNNSDVTNVGKLLDATQKVIGTWATIVDTINKIADVKPVAAGAFEMIEGVVDRLIDSAERLAKRFESTALVGLTDMAASVKAAADILSTGASMDLAGAAKVTAGALEAAEHNITAAGAFAWKLVTNWLKTAGDEKVRKAWIDSLKDYQDTVSAAVGILKAGDAGDLSEIAKVTGGQLEVAAHNITEAGKFAWGMVTGWLKNAGDADARRAWIEALEDYRDTIGAAVDIFRAGVDASGKLEDVTALAGESLDTIKQNLIDIASMVSDLATWSFGFGDGLKAWADNVKTAVDLFNAGAGASATLEDVVAVTGDHMAIVKQNLIDIASNMSDLAAWEFTWPETFKAWADNLKTALDLFKAGADASKTLADVASVAQHHMEIVKQNLIDIASMVSDAATWEFAFSETFKAWADNVKVALDVFKAGADASKTLEDVSSVAVHQFDIVKQNVIDIATMVADLATWEFAWPDKFDEWAKGVTTAVGMFAAVVKSMADVGGGTVPNLAGKLGPLKDAVIAMLKMIGEIAADIGIEEAKARADLAEAIGRASSAMGDFSGGISGLMELAQSKLFGSTAGRTGMGHTQRTRTNRADFFAQQLADTVKRAVGAVQDALNGITLTVDDAKVAALAALGDAFGKIADGLTKLAEAKMPDARQLAEIAAALLGAQGLGGGVGGTGGGAGGGSPMTLNLSNPSLVFQTPIMAAVTVNTSPVVMIGTRTIETLATIVEQKIAERFVLGGGAGTPIVGTP